MTALPLPQLVEQSDQSNEGAPVRATATAKWLRYQHAEYRAKVGHWAFVRDNYTAELLEPGKIHKYLQQRRQGEGNEAFKERARTADYSNHLAVVVDSLAGMLAAVEGDTNRTWGETQAMARGVNKTKGLGDPMDVESEAYRLTESVDGRGMQNDSFWNQVAIELSLTHTGWLFVDPQDGNPVYRYITPEEATNWFEKDGRLASVVLREVADTRQSIEDQPGVADNYLVLELDGWTRWRVRKETATLIDDGRWTFQDEHGNAVLPIRQIELPMRREVGWILAHKNIAIFNRESERDWPLRVANFARLLVDGDAPAFKKLVESLKAGHNVLHGIGHKYIAPSTEGAALATEVLNDKRTDFYITAFREYGDSAKVRTATEVRQDVAAGAQAYLTHLAATLDEGETWAMRTATQALFPKDKSLWLVPRAKRSDNFLPADPEKVIDRLIKRMWGEKPVPLGKTAQVEAAKMVAEWTGISTTDDEIESAVTSRLIVDVLEKQVLPIPAPARAMAVVKLLAASGLISADEEIELEGEGKMLLIDFLEKQASTLAEAEDLAKRREAETLIPPPGPGNLEVTDGG